MDSLVKSAVVNTNPLRFEEIAASIASLYAYARDGNGDLDAPLRDLDVLIARARRQSLGFADVTELTGQGLNATDTRAGRAAWLLQNIESMQILGVHTLICHCVSKRFQSPLLSQLSTALNVGNSLTDDKLQAIGRGGALLDAVAIRNDSVCLVQAINEKHVLDTAVTRSAKGRRSLFKSRVFDDPVLNGASLTDLQLARQLVGEAFPSVDVLTLALVLHPSSPDFELYQVEIANDADHVVLSEDWIVRNSIDFANQIAQDHELLWTIPERHDDEFFRGIPPCRGGRTLNILAVTASRQFRSDDLLLFREGDVSKLLMDEFGFDVPRDKVRHDLIDRLVGQGFMRKWGSGYFVTMKGIARYLFYLAKYSNADIESSVQVVEACTNQRDRIVNRFGCVV